MTIGSISGFIPLSVSSKRPRLKCSCILKHCSEAELIYKNIRKFLRDAGTFAQILLSIIFLVYITLLRYKANPG